MGRVLPWLVVFPLLPVLLAACLGSRQGAAPAWIDAPNATYSSDQFLTGLGRGSTAENATERAYGAVARIFEADVSQHAEDRESFLAVDNRGTRETRNRLSVEQVTRVSTEKVLEQVRVLEHWRDPASGLHYVLAGVPRGSAAAALVERLAEMDQQIAAHIETARHGADVLARIKGYRRAIQTLMQREARNAELRVLDAEGKGRPTAHSVAGLTRDLETLLDRSLRIDIRVEGPEGQSLRQTVAEGLLAKGLPVGGDPPVPGPDETAVALQVRGAARLADLEVPDPRFTYVRWCADFVIVELASGQVIAAVSGGGREGHVTLKEARARAVQAMQAEVTRELAATLGAHIYGEPLPKQPTAPPACTREDLPATG